MSLARAAIEEHGAVQKGGELESLIEYLAPLELRNVLEIGSQDSGMLWLFCQLATERVVSIDLDLVPPVEDARVIVTRIRGDSHSKATRAMLPRVNFDLLFIDGDHSYDGACQDIEMYSPLVQPGGVIALHDIRPHENTALSEVDRLWSELLPSHPEAVEFICDDFEDTWRGRLPIASCGIGVIRQR